MPAITTAFAQGVAASRPAASSANAGFYFFATDTGILSQSTGSAWTQVAAGASADALSAKGDVLTRTSSAYSRLGVGSNDAVLTADSTQSTGLKWAAAPGFANPMTTQDDVIVGGSSGTPGRLAKGSDGQVLTVDPTTHHLLWATPSAGLSDPTTTKGDLIVHGASTTRLGVGSNAQVLTADSAQSSGIKWATPATSGAPSTDTYLLQTADATNVPNGITIPGIAGWIDKAGQLPPGITSSGSPIAEEYESGTTGLTWTGGTPTVVDSNTTIKSHLYIKCTSASEQLGLRAWTPSGAFDAAWHLVVGNDNPSGNASCGPLICSASNNERAHIEILPNTSSGTYTCSAYTYASGSYTLRKAVSAALAFRYFRLARDGSNNVSFYVSLDGLAWHLINTTAFTFTPTQIGYRVAMTATAAYVVSDWLRTNQ